MHPFECLQTPQQSPQSSSNVSICINHRCTCSTCFSSRKAFFVYKIFIDTCVKHFLGVFNGPHSPFYDAIHRHLEEFPSMTLHPKLFLFTRRIDKHKTGKVHHPRVLELSISNLRRFSFAWWIVMANEIRYVQSSRKTMSNMATERERSHSRRRRRRACKNKVIDWGQTTKSIYYLKACHLWYNLISFK